MTELTFYDLFAGIGGFRLGLERAGFKCIGGCEIDEYARHVYAKNFGHEPGELDATTLDPGELPDVDLLCAGFPCQAFSVAGKRLGFEDTRGTLFYEIARIARQKRPRYLLLENVAGLLYHDNGRTFAEILATLDELGYDAEWQVLNSKYYVPQNRERIFIIGYLRGTPRPEVFPIEEGGGFDNQTRPEALCEGQRVQDKVCGDTIAGTIDANYRKSTGRTMIYLSQKNANMKQRIQDRNDTWTLTSAMNDFAIVDDPKLKQIGNIDTKGHNSMWGRVYDPDGISQTLGAEGGGLGAKTGLYKVEGCIRKLTPLECERLQGFPDNWTEGISDTQRYRCIGNAVTVPVITDIGLRLMKSITLNNM